MAPRGMLTVTTGLLCLLLGLLTPAPAALGSAWSKSCCTRYHRKPILSQNIRGYREQTPKENCRIEAIIFFTVRKLEICVNPKDKWVKNILKSLSSKLSKMSKDGSAAGETHTKKGVTPAFNDGSGSFLSTTETYPNSTQSFD
ncbi:C-C motif chemokine 20 [Nibea albiflora]|uniref:C-C motif chemokine 20 n=1 Tax=Nibea albiflora TaxID=240163 RepID=A0ACB7FII2_NIBAL|nr:C-C motif chemokine 20 [Nibea albiflora]